MSTVVYLPQKPSFGENLGAGVSQGLSQYVQRDIQEREKQQYMQKVQATIQAIQQAPSRDVALEIVSKFPHPDAGSIQNAMKAVDTFHPPSDNTPVEVKGFDQQTGEERNTFVKRGDTLNPGAMQKALGPGAGLSKPQIETFYRDEGGVPIETGKKRVEARQQGEYTQKEFDQLAKSRADKRAETRADKQIDVDATRASTEKRLADQGDIRNSLSSVNVLKDIANTKKSIGVDGSITLDFEGDPEKQQQFAESIKMLPELTKKLGPLKAAAEAARLTGLDRPTPKKVEAAPTAKKEEGGAVTNFIKSLTSKANPIEFATEAEAAAAEKAGKLKKGTKVTIGGKSGTWR